MKEIPILFSGEMVRAILAGRKTQTRRVMKPMTSQKWLTPELLLMSPSAYPCLIKGEQWAQFIHPSAGKTEEGPHGLGLITNSPDSPLGCVKCPYGKVGDVLWVRENWRVDSWCSEAREMSIGYDTGDGFIITCDNLDESIFLRLWEQSCDDLAKAGYELNPDGDYEDYESSALRLRPSIHMPKDAARIWLRVVDVRVERVQDISADDAVDEGIYRFLDEEKRLRYQGYSNDADSYGNPIASFSSLWESINGRESWDSNPWVWVVEFEVLSVAGKPVLRSAGAESEKEGMDGADGSATLTMTNEKEVGDEGL